MNREKRSFDARDEFERQDLLDSIWCERCSDTNGLENPQEYESEGLVYLEGNCGTCGEEIVARIDVLAE